MKKKSAKSKTLPESGIIISIEEANALTTWIPDSKKKCDVCGREKVYYIKTSTVDTVCKTCCEAAIEKELIDSNAAEWPSRKITKALSPSGLIVERLAVLTHMESIQHKLDLRELLINNLGFVSSHPLSHNVRQMAFNACGSYHHEQAMFKSLAKTFQYVNWQQQVNVAKLCFSFSPEDTRSIMKCTEAATSSSPSARIHMAQVVGLVDAPWAKKIWDNLCRDANPLVRETCQDISRQHRKKIPPVSPFQRTPEFMLPKTASRSKTEKVVFSDFEKSLNNAFNFRQLQYKKVHTQYLKDLLELMDPDTIGDKAFKLMSGNTQAGFIKSVAAVLCDKMLFETLLKKLPAEVGILIYRCTWENQFFATKTELADLTTHSRKDKEAPIPETLFSLIGEPFSSKANWDVEVYQNPGFFLFQVGRLWHEGHSSYGYKFSMKQLIRDKLKRIIPMPASYHVTSLEMINANKYITHRHKDIFDRISTLAAYIVQDQLEFTKNGKKIKVNSLKKMADMCRIDEYYPAGPAQQRHLKTQLLADFFISGTSWNDEETEGDLAASLKKRIQLFLNFEGYQTFRCRDLLSHIKRQQEEYDEDDDESDIRLSFQAALQMLSPEGWVSVDNLAQALRYRGFHLSPFTFSYERQRLQLDVANEYFQKEWKDPYTSFLGRNTHLERVDEFDAVEIPLIKALLFLFGALDVVELAYTEPRNDRIYKPDSSYLTVYDGLSYVRLTDFGAYVLGLKASYAVSVEKKSAEIIIGEGRLMLSIIGEDPVKQLALETVGQQITRSSYMVDYHSFLRGCTTQHDVENRIKYFRSHIAEKPPAIWEGFFQSVLTRMEPLKAVEEMLIFKVQPDRELISHLTTDPVLKQHVMKAEDYHLLIPKKAYAKVKKALKQLGYFHS